MTAILIQLKDGTDYHRENIQFCPGQLFHGPNLENYQKAYAADAAHAGYSLQEAHQMYTTQLTQKLNARFLPDLRRIESEKNSKPKITEQQSPLPRSPPKTPTTSPQIQRLPRSPRISKLKLEPIMTTTTSTTRGKTEEKIPEKKRSPKES